MSEVSLFFSFSTVFFPISSMEKEKFTRLCSKNLISPPPPPSLPLNPSCAWDDRARARACRERRRNNARVREPGRTVDERAGMRCRKRTRARSKCCSRTALPRRLALNVATAAALSEIDRETGEGGLVGRALPLTDAADDTCRRRRRRHCCVYQGKSRCSRPGCRHAVV